MTQLKEGVCEARGTSQEAGSVIPAAEMELASCTLLRREPGDMWALLLGSLQLESEALTRPQDLPSEGTTALSSGALGLSRTQPCPLGALNLEEETFMKFPG